METVESNHSESAVATTKFGRHRIQRVWQRFRLETARIHPNPPESILKLQFPLEFVRNGIRFTSPALQIRAISSSAAAICPNCGGGHPGGWSAATATQSTVALMSGNAPIPTGPFQRRPAWQILQFHQSINQSINQLTNQPTNQQTK